AIYAARAGLSPLLIEGFPSGGQLMETTEVENFPGYPDGVIGPQLIEDLKKQAERFGTRFIFENVEKFALTASPKVLTISGGVAIKTNAVILATGATARYLGLDNEAKLKGQGVSACAVCDGFFFRDQDVCVVGGGDSALEDALFLTHHARSVTIVHRREELRASKIMRDRAQEHPRISFAWNSVVVDLVGDPKDKGLEGVVLKDVKTNELRTLPVTGMFVAIGHVPATNLFHDQVKLDAKGFIDTVGKTSATNIPGVFAAGDVMDPVYKQAITAAGSGCKAALDVEKWLIENNH
ncbi:thioredoxin-disulfide reductase, partial [Myxococcota bacterium]|nr:thioredoxin-disulfide reductase [Myxococcota bacterium]